MMSQVLAKMHPNCQPRSAHILPSQEQERSGHYTLELYLVGHYAAKSNECGLTRPMIELSSHCFFLALTPNPPSTTNSVLDALLKNTFPVAPQN